MSRFLKIDILPLVFVLAVVGCQQKEDPEVTQALQRGEEALEMQNYSAAREQFQEIAKLEMTDQTRARLFRNVSSCFLYENQLDSALFYSERARDLAPAGSYAYHLNAGEVYLLQNKIQRALNSFHQAIKVDPKQTHAFANLALIYRGDYGEKWISESQALTNIQRAISLRNTPANQEILGELYIQLEQYDLAKPIFAQLMESFPSVVRHRFNYGLSCLGLGDSINGMQHMQAAADRDEQCRVMLETILDEN